MPTSLLNFVSSLPSLARNDIVKDERSCSVCHRAYSKKATGKRAARQLRCNHIFCLKCLKRLVRKRTKVTCPMCRGLIRETDEDEEEEESVRDTYDAGGDGYSDDEFPDGYDGRYEPMEGAVPCRQWHDMMGEEIIAEYYERYDLGSPEDHELEDYVSDEEQPVEPESSSDESSSDESDEQESEDDQSDDDPSDDDQPDDDQSGEYEPEDDESDDDADGPPTKRRRTRYQQ